MKNKYLVLMIVTSLFILNNAMEDTSDTPSLNEIKFEQHYANPLLFLATTAAPLIAGTLSGSYALYNLLKGQMNSTSLIGTTLSGAFSLGCGYATYKFGYPYFKSEQGPLGYERNEFQDNLRRLLELESGGEKIHPDKYKKVIEENKEAFEKYFLQHKQITALLFIIAPNRVIKDAKKYTKEVVKGVWKTLSGK